MKKVIRIYVFTVMLTFMLLLFLGVGDNYSKEINNLNINNDIEIIEEYEHNFDDIYSSLIYEEHSETRIKTPIEEGTCPSDSCTLFHVVNYCLYIRSSYYSHNPGVCKWTEFCDPVADAGSSCESCYYQLRINQPLGPFVSLACLLYYPRVIGSCCYQQDSN